MTEWCGRADREIGRLPVDLERLPEPLRDWHLLVMRLNTSFRPVKKMLPPGQMRSCGNKIVFLEEWTGEWEWAFDSGASGIVYDRELYEDWQQVAESLPEFIQHNAIHEIIHGAGGNPRYQCRDVDNQFLAEISSPMDEIGFRGWRWPVPGGRIFVGDGIAAQLLPATRAPSFIDEIPNRSHVMVAAIDSGDLAYLDRIPHLKWTRINCS